MSLSSGKLATAYTQCRVNWNWDEWRLVDRYMHWDTPRCTKTNSNSSDGKQRQWPLTTPIENSTFKHLFVQSGLHTLLIQHCPPNALEHCIAIFIIIRQQNETWTKKNPSRGPKECFCTWNLHHHHQYHEENLLAQKCCYRKQFYLHGQLPFCKHFWMIFLSHRASSCAHDDDDDGGCDDGN